MCPSLTSNLPFKSNTLYGISHIGGRTAIQPENTIAAVDGPVGHQIQSPNMFNFY